MDVVQNPAIWPKSIVFVYWFWILCQTTITFRKEQWLVAILQVWAFRNLLQFVPYYSESFRSGPVCSIPFCRIVTTSPELQGVRAFSTDLFLFKKDYYVLLMLESIYKGEVSGVLYTFQLTYNRRFWRMYLLLKLVIHILKGLLMLNSSEENLIL